MATAVQFCLPVKVVILNNGYLGMVRQWQELFYENRYSCTNMEHAPDFVKLAEAYGAVSLRAVKPEELDFVLAKAFSIHDKPVLIECLIDPEENVFPMVNPGAALHEMVEG